MDTVSPATTAAAHTSKGIDVPPIAPEHIGSYLGIPITNTLLMSWTVVILLVVLAAIVGRRLKMTPSRIQTLFEWLVEFVYDYIAEVLESRDLARKFFPYLTTIFLFVFTSNLIEFTPGIGSIGIYENGHLVPLLRSVNTDLNVTLMLALLSFVVIEATGVAVLGAFKYGGKFLNFSGGAIGFIVGIFEFVSEVARIIAFSFRLFGNVFAGEVLLTVIGTFLPVAAPVPVMMFELFVGFVQAAIFALLTLFFIKLAIMDPHGEAAH